MFVNETLWGALATQSAITVLQPLCVRQGGSCDNGTLLDVKANRTRWFTDGLVGHLTPLYGTWDCFATCLNNTFWLDTETGMSVGRGMLMDRRAGKRKRVWLGRCVLLAALCSARSRRGAVADCYTQRMAQHSECVRAAAQRRHGLCKRHPRPRQPPTGGLGDHYIQPVCACPCYLLSQPHCVPVAAPRSF